MKTWEIAGHEGEPGALNLHHDAVAWLEGGEGKEWNAPMDPAESMMRNEKGQKGAPFCGHPERRAGAGLGPYPSTAGSAASLVVGAAVTPPEMSFFQSPNIKAARAVKAHAAKRAQFADFALESRSCSASTSSCS